MRAVAAAAFGLSLLVAPASARGDLEWQWARFRTSEHVAVIGAGVGFATMYAIPPRAPTRGGGVLFDDGVRSAWRGETRASRRAGAIASDIAYLGLLFEPLVLEGPIVPLARGSRDVAQQITLINVEAFAFTGLFFRVVEVSVARARPHVWDCLHSGKTNEQCRDQGVRGTNSFMSGHAGVAATGAALICMHQMNLQLYGRVGAPLTCGVGISLAVLAGVGRIVADRHYATDVLAGWIAGTLSGILVPQLLHYNFRREDTVTGSAPVTVSFGSGF